MVRDYCSFFLLKLVRFRLQQKSAHLICFALNLKSFPLKRMTKLWSLWTMLRRSVHRCPKPGALMYVLRTGSRNLGRPNKKSVESTLWGTPNREKGFRREDYGFSALRGRRIPCPLGADPVQIFPVTKLRSEEFSHNDFFQGTEHGKSERFSDLLSETFSDHIIGFTI